MKYFLVCEIFFKKICFTTQLTKTLQVFIHKIDCTQFLLKTMRAFLYLINFDTMSKCLQNIVALKKPLPEVYASSVGKFAQLHLL